MGVCVSEEGDLTCKLGCVRLSLGLTLTNARLDNERPSFAYLDSLKTCVKALEAAEVVHHKARLGCMWTVLSTRIILPLVFPGGLCTPVSHVPDGGF